MVTPFTRQAASVIIIEFRSSKTILIQKEEVSSKIFTGQRWLQKVLHHLWTHLYMAWKLRNANLHGIDAVGQEVERITQLSFVFSENTQIFTSMSNNWCAGIVKSPKIDCCLQQKDIALLVT